jgi:hypothetical protein
LRVLIKKILKEEFNSDWDFVIDSKIFRPETKYSFDPPLKYREFKKVINGMKVSEDLANDITFKYADILYHDDIYNVYVGGEYNVSYSSHPNGGVIFEDGVYKRLGRGFRNVPLWIPVDEQHELVKRLNYEKIDGRSFFKDILT